MSFFRFALVVCVGHLSMLTAPSAASAQNTAPLRLDAFVGWWIGQGRLGFRGGQTETIKCRAVYRKIVRSKGLSQAVRCATTSGNVDIASEIRLDGTMLTGRWREKKYNIEGELTGAAVPGGFRVDVSGPDLSANMTVVARGDRQIVEVQFNRGSLLGLTVLMRRGAP